MKDPRSSRYEYGGIDALCASAGGKPDRNGCLHPERSGFSPGAGDLRIAGVAAAPFQATSPTPVSLLCVLGVFVVATIFGSVSLCLCGFVRVGIV